MSSIRTISAISFATAAAILLAAGPVLSQQSDAPKGPELKIPGLPPLQLPPGTRVFGPNGEQGSQPKSQKQADTTESKSAGKRVSKPKKPIGRKAVLDELFNRLGKAKNAREARGIVRSIEQAWMNSGSDTADLLMQRAVQALKKKNHKLALQLLDKVVYLEPGWSEVWNKRATVRYYADDPDGAVADIAEVLSREPRHFGALVGLGFILRRANQEQMALRVFRRALAINPRLSNIKSIIDKLKVTVEGQGI
jgi:tetratricopeptide (TPR) repeat protein